jgi:hypothetical protein
MTVAEYIQALELLPQDAPVVGVYEGAGGLDEGPRQRKFHQTTAPGLWLECLGDLCGGCEQGWPLHDVVLVGTHE